MNPEWYWARPVQGTLLVSAVAGIFFAVFAPRDAPLEVVLGTAVIFGTIFGATALVIRRNSWPTGRKLTASERTAAVRAVFRGEDVGATGPARAVSELAGIIITHAERSHRRRWPPWIALAVTAVAAVDATATGAVLQPALSWLLVGILLWTIVRQPRRIARSGACAVRAQLLALDRMQT